MHETTVSLNEEKRRAQQADIEKRQLALQNALRRPRARNRWPSWRRKRKPRRTRKWTSLPEDDAYLSESGRILLDYLGLSSAMAKH